VLLHADAPVEPRLVEIDPRNVMVSLPGASLAPTATTLLSPLAQGSVVRVTAFDRARPDAGLEVRVVVQRRPGAPPRLTRSGSVVALEFDALPRPVATPEATLSLANRRAPVQRVITEVARATGETLVFDDAVSGLGVITIEGPGRFTHDEARALVDEILLLKGFARVPGPAGVEKIVPIKGAPSPWAPGGELEDSAAPATTLVRLETVVASEILTLLTPYLGTNSTAVAFEPTNSLILAGPASRLSRLRDVLLTLDRIESGMPVFWTLRDAEAQATAEQVQEILGEREVPMAIGDPRTNMLLLRVHPGSLERARDLVDRLDRPSQHQGELEVVPLRYADPVALAEQLVSLRDDLPQDPEDPAADRSGLRGLDFHVVARVAIRRR
jgi:type II secretory pathway component GspD/PulD (secretin)